jgi:Cu/Zn superoxide dismutase
VNSDGLATVNFIDTLISLYPGKNSIVDRSIVIHKDSDDEGIPGLLALQSGKKLNKKESESLKTGNAGNRIACGNIKLV